MAMKEILINVVKKLCVVVETLFKSYVSRLVLEAEPVNDYIYIAKVSTFGDNL